MHRTLRILQVTPAYPPAPRMGGVPYVVQPLAEGLAARGHQVSVFTTDRDYDRRLDMPTEGARVVNGVEVRRFPTSEWPRQVRGVIPYVGQSVGYLYSAEMARELRLSIRGFDVVHTHLPFVYPTLVAASAARRARVPLFYQQHGVLDPDRMRVRGLKKQLYYALLERRIVRNAACLIALNERERATYEALAPVVPVRVLPPAVDPSAHRSEPIAVVPGLERLRPDEVVILFFGQLLPLKGPDLLLTAFASIAADHPEAHLVLVGPDPHGMGPALARHAREAGLAERVDVLGPVAGQARLDLLARADVFCLPSVREGFSLAVLEAMASRCAVILTPGCNFPSIGVEGAGMVVGRTAEEFAGALRHLLAHPAERRAMAERAQALVESRYSTRQMALTAEGIYLECSKAAS